MTILLYAHDYYLPKKKGIIRFADEPKSKGVNTIRETLKRIK
ncbi:MAG: hypothetical protein RL596_2154 [Bacteroidota bacterium]